MTGGAGDQLRAVFAAHKKEFLFGGAGIVVAVALYAKHRSASSSSSSALGTLNASGNAMVDPVTGLPTATYTGAAQVDTTATDLAGNLDPMLTQDTTLLQQILSGINNPPKRPAPILPIHPVKSPVDGSPPKRPAPILPIHPVHHPVKGPGRGRHSTTYTVRRGDTLSGIGSRFHVPWETIYRSNRGTIGGNPNLIYPGQKLRIP